MTVLVHLTPIFKLMCIRPLRKQLWKDEFMRSMNQTITLQLTFSHFIEHLLCARQWEAMKSPWTVPLSSRTYSSAQQRRQIRE